MDVPNGFEGRLLQMESATKQRLEDLQKEKEIQASKVSLLKAKALELRRIRHRCLKLEKKSAKLSSKILLKEEEIENLDAATQHNMKLRAIRRAIYEAEKERKRKQEYYELQRQEMRRFDEELEKRLSILHSEVESLENTLSKMESERTNMRDIRRHVHGSDCGIASQVETINPLSATNREHASKLASSHSIKQDLEQQLESILISQDEERKKLFHVMERQKDDLAHLQRECQDLEEKVFKAMTKRDDRKTELENINIQIAELRDLKCRSIN